MKVQKQFSTCINPSIDRPTFIITKFGAEKFIRIYILQGEDMLGGFMYLYHSTNSDRKLLTLKLANSCSTLCRRAKLDGDNLDKCKSGFK